MSPHFKHQAEACLGFCTAKFEDFHLNSLVMGKNPFDGGSSVETLKWLSQFKKLDRKQLSKKLSPSEQALYNRLATKLSSIIDKGKVPPKHQRNKIRVDKEMKISLGQESEFREVYMKNISGGGLYIECQPQPPMGASINIKLQIEETNKSMLFEAEVAWVNPKPLSAMEPGVGAKFKSLTEEQNRFLQDLIHRVLDQKVKS